VVRDELLALERRKVESAARLEVSVAPLIQPNMPELCRQEVTRLRDALSLPEGRTEGTALLRNFRNEIRLTPAEGILTIAVKGNSAGVLSAAGISALASGDGWLAAAQYRQPSIWWRHELQTSALPTRRSGLKRRAHERLSFMPEAHGE